MSGPILDTKKVVRGLGLTATTATWFTPKAIVPYKKVTQPYLSARTDSISKFRYKQSKIARAYFNPLPYDTYGSRELAPLSIDCTFLYRTRNTTPWVTPYWQYQWRERKLNGDMVRGVPSPIPPLPEREPEGALITEALSKVNSALIDLTVILAEMDSTLGMFARRIKQLDRALRLIRKGKFSKAAKSLGIRTPRGVARTKHWSDNFLEYQYGWVPVISDVCSGAQFFAELLLTTPVLVSKARYEEVIDPVHSVETVPIFPPDDGNSFNAQHYANVRKTTAVTERHDVTLNFALESHLFRELSKLGAMSPLQSALDLVPLSFVVDWFANVSDVLSAYSITNGLRFTGGSYTRTAKCAVTAEISTVTAARYSGEELYSSEWTASRGEYEGWCMRREVYTFLPPPELVISLPGTQGWKKSIVAAALLRQRLPN